MNEVNFSVGWGVCFVLLGPNGAGKSTTLRMIYGSVRPTAGLILVGGENVALEPRKARAMLGIAPQEDLLDPDLTVAQNLRFHARYHRLAPEEAEERCRATLRDNGLEVHADAQVAHLSTGLRRRLVLARALIHDPAIVILDEPTRGLDRESRQRHLETLQRLKSRGATFILATHDLLEAEVLCDRAAIMEEGRITREASFPEILELCRSREPAQSPGETAS